MKRRGFIATLLALPLVVKGVDKIEFKKAIEKSVKLKPINEKEYVEKIYDEVHDAYMNAWDRGLRFSDEHFFLPDKRTRSDEVTEHLKNELIVRGISETDWKHFFRR